MSWRAGDLSARGGCCLVFELMCSALGSAGRHRRALKTRRRRACLLPTPSHRGAVCREGAGDKDLRWLSRWAALTVDAQVAVAVGKCAKRALILPLLRRAKGAWVRARRQVLVAASPVVVGTRLRSRGGVQGAAGEGLARGRLGAHSPDALLSPPRLASASTAPSARSSLNQVEGAQRAGVGLAPWSWPGESVRTRRNVGSGCSQRRPGSARQRSCRSWQAC